ncbi:hypothetical protein PIB30_099623 [Stylosanthes scabra]|uniref:Putative plant transposon protein domain-containing protein n=1 Tax=Stylosanthes scabra TaxID=79078 RepID=A0ABU6ZW09_9FABA|nr:hypothetical protein [Stylosanthes scabra]
MEQIALRGWRRLAAPRTDISKLLVQEFYANAAVSDEEAAVQEVLPYKSFVRGKEIDFSPNNIRRVMRFKRETVGAQTDYKTRQALNQRLDEVLANLCILGATWKLSSSQPPVPIQLRRTELQPLVRGWQEFIIHSLVPTGNKSEITTSRAILIHTIMQGEDVRAEEIITDNMVTIAQGLASKGNLAHPTTIYKLCKDTVVPLREFARTPRIPSLSYITAKRMETIRFPRHQQPQQQEDKEEDEPMPEADGGNFEEDDQQPPQQNQPPQQDQQPQQHGFPNFQPRYESQYHEDLQGIEETLSSMQFFQQTLYENMQKSQADYMEEVKQIKEKQEQIYNQNQRFHAQIWQEQEKLAKEIQEVRRGQLAQSDYGASSSSQVDPEEPVPLRTAPPSPHFRPPYPPPN